jgi:hypothetical protein
MVLGLIFTVVYNLCWKDTVISVIKTVLTLEWLMIWAFGFACWSKGKHSGETRKYSSVSGNLGAARQRAEKKARDTFQPRAFSFLENTILNRFESASSGRR